MRSQWTGRMSRETFLNRLLGAGVIAWLGSVLYPIFEFLRLPPQTEATPTSVVATNLAKLQAEGAVIFKFGSGPAVVVIGPDGVPRAFSAVCTHLQCTVQYRPDLQHLWCACHGGVFDLYGRNVSGPPPKPLAEYKVVTRGDDVVVSKA